MQKRCMILVFFYCIGNNYETLSLTTQSENKLLFSKEKSTFDSEFQSFWGQVYKPVPK